MGAFYLRLASRSMAATWRVLSGESGVDDRPIRSGCTGAKAIDARVHDPDAELSEVGTDRNEGKSLRAPAGSWYRLPAKLAWIQPEAEKNVYSQTSRAQPIAGGNASAASASEALPQRSIVSWLVECPATPSGGVDGNPALSHRLTAGCRIKGGWIFAPGLSPRRRLSPAQT